MSTSVNANKPIHTYSVWFGSDPEIFIADQKGLVMGSESVVPKDGIITPQGGYGKVVRDGVQVELHPFPSTCRQSHSLGIAFCLQTLKDACKPKEYSISFRPVVDMDPMVFEGLTEDSKRLGCAPSLNAYDVTASIYPEGGSYLTRSAGGHIHLGLLHGFKDESQWKKSYAPSYPLPYVFQHRERLVPLLDILVGNTAVLFDRDPYAAKRREVYGRAGEYRLPDHGIEYRTLSNFWLHSVALYSLMFALARQAVGVLHTEGTGLANTWGAADELLRLVDVEKVQKAINTNDVELAWHNFEGVRKFIHDHCSSVTHCHSSGLLREHLTKFEKVAKRVQADGLTAVWPSSPMEVWSEMNSQTYTRPFGWESFISAFDPSAKSTSNSSMSL